PCAIVLRAAVFVWQLGLVDRVKGLGIRFRRGDGVALRSQYSVQNTKYLVLWTSLVLAIGLIGCRRPSTAIKLIQGDAKALDELIATHKGQVVLVDYWATWCGPCVENFPHTVELAKKYREQGLVAIAVNFDLLD